MKKYVLIGVFLLTLAGGAGWMQKMATPDESTSGAEPPRPSPIQEQLPRRPVEMAGETVRTRMADKVQAAEKPRLREQPGSDWAVVMAIYKEYEAAQRRARNISEGTSFKASVYPGQAGASKYMVVLDSGLTHGEACLVRERAVSGGLPPDTYVTRLTPSRE